MRSNDSSFAKLKGYIESEIGFGAEVCCLLCDEDSSFSIKKKNNSWTHLQFHVSQSPVEEKVSGLILLSGTGNIKM